MTTPPLLDSAQVAALLKCSARTVEDYARSGRLPAAKFGEGWVFPSDALFKAINKIAEEEALRRLRPTPPTAIGRQVAEKLPKKASRPNLNIL